MKLEVGKVYVRRDGQVSGVIAPSCGSPYYCDKFDETYFLSGRESSLRDKDCDLIRLATPEEIAAGKALPEAVQLSPESVMELRGDIDAMHAEREAKDARIATLERDLASRQALLDIADKQVGRLAFDCAEAAERIKELEQNVKYAEGLASMVIDERDELRTQLAKERAELEARTTELEGYLSERSSTVENQNAFIVDLMTERDALKTQVADLSQLYAEETQGRHQDYDALSRVSKERDELRAECEAWSKTNFEITKQLAEANEKLAALSQGAAEQNPATILVTREILEHYVKLYGLEGDTELFIEDVMTQQYPPKPAEPTIVKQTWARIAAIPDGTTVSGSRKPERDLDLSGGNAYLLGFVRHDFYSDGTVRVELEKVEGGG